AASPVLLRAHLSARLPDGLSDADRDDVAGAARQGSHVPVGVGHQRLFLRDRRGRRSHYRDLVRPQRRADDCRRRLSLGDAGVLRGAAAAATVRDAYAFAGCDTGVTAAMYRSLA